ncbi:glycosyltransferase [Flavihumibacter sp. R14]|nr:glycosyltransferase [Flavihumibacter soli]
MKIAYISTNRPRECGIATFNHNLFNAISGNYDLDLQQGYVVALTDSDDPNEYRYPEEVKLTIRQEHQKDYIKAANYINSSDTDACILEHEFGIFGGQDGVYILPLINHLQKPLITILHTVLKSPSYLQGIIIREIASQSSKIVVMNRRAIGFLTEIYRVPEEKIKLIEHGVPDMEPKQFNPVKNSNPFRNKKVLFTFGLLSTNKGIETVIKALPEVIDRYPEVMYVVLGNTHPGVRKNSGEEYRERLKTLASRLQVDKNLEFINKFVSDTDLFNYLTASDIYITPYLNEAQITSGTLSYAVGAGSAVISTPYWHAQELLADNRGRLFDFRDSEGLALQILDLLDNPDKLSTIKQNAYEYGLQLRWPVIGREYIKILNQAVEGPINFQKKPWQIIDSEIIPAFSLAHVKRLTDDTGIVQHAKYGIPNLKEGYCLDDNARALIMALMSYQQNKSRVALELLPVYLSYIQYMQDETGNFRNFLSFDRRYLDEVGSEDSFGRTVWALGFSINCAPNNSYREFAEELFFKSVPHFKSLKHLRGIANTIIGVANYLRVHPFNEDLTMQLSNLTKTLTIAYNENHSPNWRWFEEKMTYDNAILPLALLHSNEIIPDDEVRDIALKSIEFLEAQTMSHGYLSPVGSEGWFFKNGSMAVFDQQAIEVMGMVLMYFEAYQRTRKFDFISKMYLSYKWFLGENTLRIPLYDHETQGCCDGLQAHGINRNQGAESTLAYLISHLTVLKALELEYEYKETADPDKAPLNSEIARDPVL